MSAPPRPIVQAFGNRRIAANGDRDDRWDGAADDESTLSGVTVLGSGATGSIVLSVGLDGRFLMDPAMREPGTC